jgi:hypothetical protein
MKFDILSRDLQETHRRSRVALERSQHVYYSTNPNSSAKKEFKQQKLRK